MNTVDIEREIIAGIEAAAPEAAAILSAAATPVTGAIVGALLLAGAKAWAMALDPVDALVAVIAETDPLAAARGKVQAAEAAKFGGPTAVASAGVSERETADDPYPDPSEDV